jgi:putative protease
MIADYGFNVLNSAAVTVLEEIGAVSVTVSNEAGLADLSELAASSTLPLEILAHGPVTGMLLEHCLLAMYVTPQGRKDVCRGPCRHVAFGLKDRLGQVRPIVADQHCRNHLLTGHDLATLPVLERLLLPAVHVIRIEGQFYHDDVVRAATRAYRTRLELLSQGQWNGTGWQRAWEDLVACSPRPYNLGPYPRSVVESRTTAAVMKEMAHA